MNRHTAWRDVWLVLTVITTSLALLAGVLVSIELVRDPHHVAAIALRTDSLTQWPPIPDKEQLALLAPAVLAFLAWRFHRYHHDCLAAIQEGTPDDPGDTEESP